MKITRQHLPVHLNDHPDLQAGPKAQRRAVSQFVRYGQKIHDYVADMHAQGKVDGSLELAVKQALAGMDVARTWKRYKREVAQVIAANSSQISQLEFLVEDVGDIMHYKDINCRMSFAYGTSTSYRLGSVGCKWYVWNTELISSLSATQVGKLDLDYTINRRERYYYFANRPTFYDTRFPGFILRPDEVGHMMVDPQANVQPTANNESYYINLFTTGFNREVSIGEL